MEARFKHGSDVSYFKRPLITIDLMILTVLLLVVFLNMSWASEIRVVYPDREGIEERSTYPYALLDLALKKSLKDYSLVPSQSPMNDARARIELSNKRISIAWFGTSKNLKISFEPSGFPSPRGYWDIDFW